MTYNPNFRGNLATAPGPGLQSDLENNTISTILAFTPVNTDSSGGVVPVDVSDEALSLDSLGITVEDILPSESGRIAYNGRVEDIPIACSFGEVLFISKTNTLTYVRPNVGVNGFTFGDFIIRVGVIVKNTVNPLNKDLIINLAIVGRL